MPPSPVEFAWNASAFFGALRPCGGGVVLGRSMLRWLGGTDMTTARGTGSGGLDHSLRSTLDWARGVGEECGVSEEERIRAQILALQVETAIVLYLGESVGCPGSRLSDEGAWQEAAYRLRRELELRARLRKVCGCV